MAEAQPVTIRDVRLVEIATMVSDFVVQAAALLAVSDRAGLLGSPSEAIGTWALWASYAYAVGMAWRAVHRVRQPPERRGVLIPIIFHFVLAGFLFVYGSWHYRGT